MNILFLTLLSFDSIKERNIYTDLLREFVKNGHQVYVISPVEKRQRQKTHQIQEENVTILRLQIGNTQKTNIFEKGISTVMIEPTFKKAIKYYFSDVKFDLVLYSTPPITIVTAIEYVKKRDGAETYLLLKDIFPQNAVDIGMMNKDGPKGLLYKYFRRKEKKLYAISDRIGCMSQANAEYVIKHNPEIKKEKIEVCPNSIEVVDRRVNTDTREKLRQKYRLPLNKKIFVYGGNLGKPQGIDFMIECLKSQEKNDGIYFLIVGDGTEYGKIEAYVKNYKPHNMKLMRQIPKEDYDRMIAACDVGMVFLDYRFTIPNFPSRLLSYMQAGLPVVACTDKSTDIGRVITDGKFGWWCDSGNLQSFCLVIEQIFRCNLKSMSENAYSYLCENYNIKDSCNKIIKGSMTQLCSKKHKKIIVNDLAASYGGALSILQSFYKYVQEKDRENEWIFLLSEPYLKSVNNIEIKVIKSIKKSWIHKLMFDFIFGKKVINQLQPDYVLSLQNIITFGVHAPQGVYIHQSIPFQEIKRFSFLKRKEFMYAVYQYLIGKVIKISAKSANDVFVQTAWMMDAVSRKSRIPQKKISIVRPDIAENYISDKVNLTYETRKFFYPTGFDAIYKNHDCIYEACRILDKENCDDYEVVLTIDKPQTEVSAKISFVGRLKREMVYKYYQSTTLIFPSYIETVGLPLIEAMSQGSIVLAADCEYAREILGNYENAFYFDPFRAETLSELMKQVMQQKIAKKGHGAFSQNAWDKKARESNWGFLIKKVLS